MIIHDSNLFQYSGASPTAAEQGVFRLRAENLRKRMNASQNETDGVTSPEEAEMIRRWMNPEDSHGSAQDERHHKPHHAIDPDEFA